MVPLSVPEEETMKALVWARRGTIAPDEPGEEAELKSPMHSSGP
jgi:hypothetical protein